jgi:hypothetical protein
MADLTLALLDGGHGYVGRAVRRLEELCALGRTSDATAARRAEPTGAAGPFGACEVAASAVGAASAEEAAAGTAGAAASRDRRGAAPSGRGASAEAVWSPCQTRQAPVSRIAPRAGPRSSTRRRGRCPHAAVGQAAAVQR